MIMSTSLLKRFLPAFIPVAYEVVKHLKRNTSHNSDIKKFDKSEEKLMTIEHLIVRLEKKAQANKEDIRASKVRLEIWLAINSALLVGIFVKLFFLS